MRSFTGKKRGTEETGDVTSSTVRTADTNAEQAIRQVLGTLEVKVPDAVDRRYQVFISSTFQDLGDERKKAVEVVVSRGQIPVDLGRFAARAQSDLAVIAQAMAQCQIYAVILFGDTLYRLAIVS